MRPQPPTDQAFKGGDLVMKKYEFLHWIKARIAALAVSRAANRDAPWAATEAATQVTDGYRVSVRAAPCESARAAAWDAAMVSVCDALLDADPARTAGRE